MVPMVLDTVCAIYLVSRMLKLSSSLSASLRRSRIDHGEKNQTVKTKQSSMRIIRD
jgi:hypothetical protein